VAVISANVTYAVETGATDGDRVLADEQAALRRVATLVAEGAPAADVFTAVTREVEQVFQVPAVSLLRYEPDRTATVVASRNAPGFPVGSRWPLDGPSLVARVFESGGSVRIDDYSALAGTVAAAVRASGFRSTVGVPITVDGHVWGVMCAATTGPEPIAAQTEARLRDFTELIGTAISNAESRERLSGLVNEQASLRRVATLIAVGATPSEVFAAVAEEVASTLDVPLTAVVRYEADGTATQVGAWGNENPFPIGTSWTLDERSLSALVASTRRPVRVDDYSEVAGPISTALARDAGIRTAVGVPILVDGKPWGLTMALSTGERTLPADTEKRLAAFTELIATTIANTQARDEVRQLADEQAALRRVATLVAQGAPTAVLCAAVAEEAAQVLDVPTVTIERYEPNRETTMLAVLNEPTLAVGSRWPLDGPSVSSAVLDTGRPARIDDYSNLPGTIAAAIRASGMSGFVGVPITVDGKVWGVIAVASGPRGPLPAVTEDRLSGFAELIATAIANAENREELTALVEDQTALRRVATLVARAAPPTAIFAAVAEQVAEILGLPRIEMVRFEDDGTGTVIGASGDHPFPVGTRWPLDGASVMGLVFRTGRPARIDDYGTLPGEIAEVARSAGFRSAIGAPVIVDGRAWGVVIAISTQPEPIPEGAEARLSQFTDLVATAISNLQARDELRGLVNQHAALRSVATLVAEGASAEELFSAVAREVVHVLDVSAALLGRYEPDGSLITVASSYDLDWPGLEHVLYSGAHWPPDPGTLTATVHGTGRGARIDDYNALEGVGGEKMRAIGVHSGCSAPIIVDGKLWGALAVFSRRGVLDGDADARLDNFTEIVATAVSNATAREELIASRARIVAAGDEARRRIERNLHDGTQQRLIALGLDLQRIRAMLPEDQRDEVSGLERMEEDLESVLGEVRELSRGLHPPLLSRGGLRPSLRALARRSPIPVDIDIELHERPPPAIETAVYYVVAEALTNAIKHSQASEISVVVETDYAGAPFAIGLDGRRGVVTLHALIADDGVGGAEATPGSGLAGLVDRVDALGGQLELDSPPGRGTRIAVVLPLGS
jgi:GAF domain-containing protein